MTYKLIYNPLIDYIRSHVCLCAVLFSIYIVRLPVHAIANTVNSGVVAIVWHASQIYYVYALIMESK